jgi:hypothetical protein
MVIPVTVLLRPSLSLSGSLGVVALLLLRACHTARTLAGAGAAAIRALPAECVFSPTMARALECLHHGLHQRAEAAGDLPCHLRGSAGHLAGLAP